MEDRRYRVLLTTTNSELGGGELSMVSLAANLNRERFDCFAMCPSGPLVKRLAASGVSVRPMDRGVFTSYKGIVPRPPWRTLRTMLSYAKESGVDVVHAHHYEACKVSGLVARWLGVPSVWTCHGFRFPVEGVKGRYLAAVLDHVVAVSRFVKERLLLGGVLRDRSVSVICNSADVPFFSEPPTNGARFREHWRIVDSSVVIGVVARLDPIKGHEDFLLALRRVLDEMPGVKAVFVGSEILADTAEEYGARIKQLSREIGVAESVIFAGFQDEMPVVYDACDLVVVPSRGEACPRVVVEAMARRRPVVATDCGGPSEIIGDQEAGILVPVGDANRLAEAILELAKNGALRRRLAESGYQRVRAEFTVETMVSKYENLYLHVLRARGDSYE